MIYLRVNEENLKDFIYHRGEVPLIKGGGQKPDNNNVKVNKMFKSKCNSPVDKPRIFRLET